MAKTKKKVSISLMYRFVRTSLGRTVHSGQSPVTLCSEILSAPPYSLDRAGWSHRKFIEKHVDIIRAAAGDVPRANPATTVKRGTLPAVATDAFLNSYEWRRIRMVVLKRDGRRCACCGTTPEAGAIMNVDHIKPRRLFPDLALDVNNLQVLCNPCNHGKGNWDMTDWRDPATVATPAESLPWGPQ